MPTYKQAAFAVLCVVILHVMALVWSLYYVLPWFDIPMHFLGGCAVALTAQALWQANVESLALKSEAGFSKQALTALFVLGCVALVGIFWEWHEFAIDIIREWQGVVHRPAQPGLFDTMKDLFFDLLGGLLTFTGVRLVTKQKGSL